MLTIRIGVPETTGRMIKYFASRPEIPVLFSANAFFGRRTDGTRYLKKMNLPQGLNAALDSAGFVAMSRYGEYPWSDEEYLDLVESYPWAWYSCPDLCVEHEIASDRREVRLRMAGTVQAYYRMCRKANLRGIAEPIPIYQGRTFDDYLWCADYLPQEGVIGLGSFCRREVGGPDGIVSIVERLHRRLPLAKFHLFGVKGKALDALGDHPGVYSVDSMAWDMAARTTMRTGRTVDYRLAQMERWLERNLSLKRNTSRPVLQVDELPRTTHISEDEDDVNEWLQLILDGEMSYKEVRNLMNLHFVDCATTWHSRGMSPPQSSWDDSDDDDFAEPSVSDSPSISTGTSHSAFGTIQASNDSFTEHATTSGHHQIERIAA